MWRATSNNRIRKSSSTRSAGIVRSLGEGGSRQAATSASQPVFVGGLGVTPYAALQAQDFHTPSYSESDATGGGFGLSYAAVNATDIRTELGTRLDHPML
jgi:uncharacterized protein with beta-barrel porin domain